MTTSEKLYKQLVQTSMRHPKCERCGTVDAEFITTTGGDYPTSAANKWEFRCGECTPEALDGYFFKITDFLRSHAGFVDWMMHLSSKKWFRSVEFVTCLHRFEKSPKNS